jgi:hypothetical protein
MQLVPLEPQLTTHSLARAFWGSCIAVIRYCRTDSADVALMAGLPLPAPRTALNQLDGLLLVKLPFKDDLRQFTFRTFNDPSKPHVSQTLHCSRKVEGDMQLPPHTLPLSFVPFNTGNLTFGRILYQSRCWFETALL